MKSIYQFIKENSVAVLIGVAVLGWYGYMTYIGSDCFSCKETEHYRPGQQNYGNRAYHK